MSPLRQEARPPQQPAPPAEAIVPGGGPAPLVPDGPPAGPAGSDLATLRQVWPQVVAQISANPPAKPLIEACRPISVEGNVVTLGFPEHQAFLQESATRRRPILEAGIGQFLGRPVTVRCIATNLDTVAPETSETDAAFLLAEARRIFADDIVEADEIR